MWLSIIVADSTRVSHCLPMWDAEKHPWYRNTRFISCLLVVGSTISHGCSSGWLVCTTRISIQRLRGTMDTDASIMPDCAKSLVWSDSFFSQSCTLIKQGWIVWAYTVDTNAGSWTVPDHFFQKTIVARHYDWSSNEVWWTRQGVRQDTPWADLLHSIATPRGCIFQGTRRCPLPR